MLRFWFFLWIFLVCFPASAFSRTWTDMQGRQIEAELVKADADKVVLRMRGKLYTLALARFIQADRDFVRRHLESLVWKNVKMPKELKNDSARLQASPNRVLRKLIFNSRGLIRSDKSLRSLPPALLEKYKRRIAYMETFYPESITRHVPILDIKKVRPLRWPKVKLAPVALEKRSDPHYQTVYVSSHFLYAPEGITVGQLKRCAIAAEATYQFWYNCPLGVFGRQAGHVVPEMRGLYDIVFHTDAKTALSANRNWNVKVVPAMDGPAGIQVLSNTPFLHVLTKASAQLHLESVIAHEITHSITRAAMSRLQLPLSVVEGLARYTEVIYEGRQGDVLSIQNIKKKLEKWTALPTKENIEAKRTLQPCKGFKTFMDQNWNFLFRNSNSNIYETGLLWIIYFIHFDPTQGRALYAYFSAVRLGLPIVECEKILMNGRSLRELEEDMKKQMSFVKRLGFKFIF